MKNRTFSFDLHNSGGIPIMSKRIIALLVCLIMCISAMAGCSRGSISVTAEDKGEQIIMYLSENVYDLDPTRAYVNESTRAVVSLLFDTLFVLDENGKVQPSLAESYSTKEDPNAGEYYMYIELADTNWSDNTPVTADDVVFAWKRVLSFKDSYNTAALLFDIKNARAYNEGEVSKDDIGLTADGKTVTIQFETPIDYDQFILNLTSLALAPLREDKVGGTKSSDWAKKPGTMVTSGAFKLSRISFSDKTGTKYDDFNYTSSQTVGNTVIYDESVKTESERFKEQVVTNFVLERNAYYYRNSEKDEMLDVSVTPYRIIVDCSMSDEDIKEAYENGTILYMGDIPMSLRSTYKDEAIVKNSLSTSVFYFNQNAEIDGDKIFAIKEVRQALSMAIDRDAIASALVFAQAANGLVAPGMFDTSSAKTLFRDAANSNYKYLAKNIEEAKSLLSSVDIDPTDYSFEITVAAYDNDHKYIAEEIKKAWCALGFEVEIKLRGTVANNDYYKPTDSIPTDICDDLYAEDLRDGKFEVILLDLVAPSVDPFSVLAPFALEFSGSGMDMSVAGSYTATPHITGYNSAEYNALIEAIYNEKATANRSANLHKAEEMLMEDMPVMPIVYNQSATLVSEELDLNNKTLFGKKSSNYYGADSLNKIEVKNFDDYVATVAAFIESKFDTYKADPLSYFGSDSYSVLTFEQFKQESSNYAYFFKERASKK